MSRYRTPPVKPLLLLQVNVGKGPEAHEIALTHAFTEGVDVLLVQEPYVYRDLSRRITKRHPIYECFTPTDDWTSGRPRVLTYVRKGAGLQATQIRPLEPNASATPDLLFLHVAACTGPALLVVNVYNAPPGSDRPREAAPALIQLPPPLFEQPTVVAGDFNLQHSLWQPSSERPQPTEAEALAAWMDDRGLALATNPDEATHDLGNVLDLTFVSSPLMLAGASTVVAYDLDATSDHRPILTSIPWDQRFAEPTRRLRFDTLDQTAFFSLLSDNLAELDTPSLSEEQLDVAASGLVTAVHSAYQGAAKRSTGQRTGQAWWNADCKQALSLYRTGDYTKRDFRKAVRRAKSQFWQGKLDAASQAKDVFDMSKWHRSTGSFRSPPLTDPRYPERPPAVTLPDKRSVLVANLLQRSVEAGDVPLDAPTVPRAALPFPEVLMTDVERAILRTGSTAPGADEIPTCVLRVAWPLIRERVYNLFEACLRLGYHPKCFRHAVLVMAQKPNKTDRSSPRSYRPIALLAVLGKGLERLIARNMAWVAVTHKVVASQQFGALPLRSAVDLTTCLTHDVEDALNQGRTASLLTLDVKGAFDAVLPGRLVRRLREQGWPDNLTRWASSFATGRTVQIRMDGDIGPCTDIQCGLPQGSPVSPILFMLYLAPLFKLGKRSERFGYADDVALLASSPSLLENSEALAAALQEALDWGVAEGVSFDPAKSELMHFSRKRTDQDPTATPAVSAGPITVSEDSGRPYLRWLGILFDKKLTFKWHSRTMATKARAVAGALRSLGNTVRGVPAHLLQQVVKACVLRRAYFGAETWWPGRTRPGRTASISNRVDGLLANLAKVVLSGARAILPVFCTTPTAALYRESGLLPPEIELDHLALLAATRIRRLDPCHPLRKRAEKIASQARPSTRLARRVLALPASEQIDPLQNPPWCLQESRDAAMKRIHGPRGRTKRQAAADFARFYQALPPQDLAIFSDGSQLEDKRTGGGFVGFMAGRQILRGSFSLGRDKEVYDAEAEAALAGLKAVLAGPAFQYVENLWFFLDNVEVAARLLSHSAGSSQEVFRVFRTLATIAWPMRVTLPHVPPGAVRVRWVPGHSKVPGNEAADQAAKEGAALPFPAENRLSYASLRRWARAAAPAASQRLWHTVAPPTYQDLGINSTPARPEELWLARSLLGRLLAARSGHGDFADYHERFNHEDAHLLCSCGSRKSPLHFFFCRRGRRRAKRPLGPPGTAVPLLSTAKGAKKLASWLADTKFFEDICPRRPL
jgi:Reverse transcriptase (RNA-dependent DNA polymerase)/Endonuclease-reverse transcriptase